MVSSRNFTRVLFLQMGHNIHTASSIKSPQFESLSNASLVGCCFMCLKIKYTINAAAATIHPCQKANTPVKTAKTKRINTTLTTTGLLLKKLMLFILHNYLSASFLRASFRLSFRLRALNIKQQYKHPTMLIISVRTVPLSHGPQAINLHLLTYPLRISFEIE